MRWSVFLVLGAMVWLAGLDTFSHPAYRLAAVLAVLMWAGVVVRTPRAV